MRKLYAWREAYLRNEDGATAIEYGLIAAGVALAISVVVFTLGDEVRDLFGGISNDISTAGERSTAAAE